MTLLGRHTPSTVGYQPFRGTQQPIKDRRCYDPLSFRFEVPPFLLERPYPYELVMYWEDCLKRLVERSGNRGLVRGKKAELRAARKLLIECGGDIELAARVVRYTADQVQVPVTLWRAVDRVPEVRLGLKADF